MAEEEISNKTFRLTPNLYIGVGTLITILIAIVGGVHKIVEFKVSTENEFKALETKYESSQKELQGIREASQNELQELRKELSEKKEALERLSVKAKAPIPYKPERDSIIIDPLDYSEVELQWIYAPQKMGTEYEIVLYSPSQGRILKPKDVTPPAKNQETVHREKFGVFFWKIGDVTNNRWSDYASFSVYQSTLDRVRATERLVVGRTRDYDRYDNSFVRLEDELVDLIAKYLERTFDVADVEVDRRKIDWGDLLEAVESGDVDIALANITKSKRREEDHHPLKFSIGYLPNYQLLVHLKGEQYPEFPDGLRGKVVGAHVGSINLKAAHAISKKYGFDVNDEARSYADSLEALQRRDIHFAMIDSVAYAERKQRMKAFECYGPSGPEFNEILREFYMRELGQPYEEIAVAVHDHHPGTADTTLLKLINEMLQSREERVKLEEFFSEFEDQCGG